MRLLKQALAVLGSILVIAVILVLVTPKAAHAVATLVQVVNTSTNPVPTQSVDNPAKEPFQAECSTDLQTGSGNCSLVGAVPSGKELVIDYMTGRALLLPGGNTPIDFFLTLTAGGTQATPQFPLPLQGPVFSGQASAFVLAQPVVLYADPGTSVQCQIDSSAASGTPLAAGQCSITGHLVKVP